MASRCYSAVDRRWSARTPVCNYCTQLEIDIYSSILQYCVGMKQFTSLNHTFHNQPIVQRVVQPKFRAIIRVLFPRVPRSGAVHAGMARLHVYQAYEGSCHRNWNSPYKHQNSHCLISMESEVNTGKSNLYYASPPGGLTPASVFYGCCDTNKDE